MSNLCHTELGSILEMVSLCNREGLPGAEFNQLHMFSLCHIELGSSVKKLYMYSFCQIELMTMCVCVRWDGLPFDTCSF